MSIKQHFKHEWAVWLGILIITAFLVIEVIYER
jgi:hypothetical protein